MASQNNWTRVETILAFELYCTIPSSKVTAVNPQIIALAESIGRTPSSVKLKLQNFKSFDPQYIADGRVGLSHGSKLDGVIVNEFLQNWDELISESADIKVRLGISPTLHVGGERVAEQKVRIGQDFFRKALLSAYNGTCCVTGLSHPQLLRASHIKPWKDSNDINEKTNPQNGLLLNALHDAAFDKGLFTLNKNYEIILSPNLSYNMSESEVLFFGSCAGKRIVLPDRFLPDKRFIEYHNDVVFRGGCA